MKRRLTAALAVLLILALMAGGISAWRQGRPRPVYTLAQVYALGMRQPTGWAGRTLLVRGRITQESWQLAPRHWAGISVDTTCYVAGSVCAAPLRGGGPRSSGLRPNAVVLYLAPQGYGSRWAGPGLNVLPDPAASWLTALRRWPVIGRIIPPAQQIQWGPYTVYRLRFLRDPAVRCAHLPCDDAVLVDGTL